MKKTGIVRRIDELGRIVIPKEIRKTMRIREMDSIEIYVAGDGEIVLKKFTPLGEMAGMARDYADVLARATGRTVCITDKERIMTAAGSKRRQLEAADISKELVAAMIERKCICASSTDKEYIPITAADTDAFTHQIINPIICEGDVLGTVILLSSDSEGRQTESDEKIVGIAADFLGCHLA